MDRSTRICVTGGHGFLGRHVCHLLAEQGYRQVTAPTHSQCDLREEAQVRQLLEELRPHAVIHLAARVGGIGANQANPATFLYDNLRMGMAVLHEAWRAGVAKLLTVGTVCAYPKELPAPFREDDLWLGYPEETNAPYGLAKKMLLVQGQAYRQQYGFNAVYVLPANLYGPGDHFEPEKSHVIPALIARFIDARDRSLASVTLWGDGTPTREFLHVRDAARGILLALERYDGPLPINLGTGRETSIAELARLLAKCCGYAGDILWDPTRPNGQPRRWLDTTRARELLGFEASIPLEEGLRETVATYGR